MLCSVNALIAADNRAEESLVFEVLLKKCDEYKVTAEDMRLARIVSSTNSKETGCNIYYLQQFVNDIPVINSSATVAIKNGKLFYLNCDFFQVSDSRYSTGLMVMDMTAVEYAVSHSFIEKYSSSIELKSSLVGVDSVVYLYDENIQTLIPSYRFEYYIPSIVEWIEVFVNAESSEILSERSMLESSEFDIVNPSYRVFAPPMKSPNDGVATVISYESSSGSSPFGWHDVDGVNGAEYTITRGNNTWVKSNLNDTQYSPDGGDNLEFLSDFNSGIHPTLNKDVALTNVFYMCNYLHDVLYAYGFDEQSGNFQVNNYGKGGEGNDAVNVSTFQDDQQNNSFFYSSADGISGEMKLGLWDAAWDDILSVNIGSSYDDILAAPASFGALIDGSMQYQNLILVEDDGSNANDGCGTILNSVSGKVALMHRGVCQFGEKVLNVQNSGAIGAIVINYDDELFNMGDGGYADQINIPVILIGNSDGDELISQLVNNEVNVKFNSTEEFELNACLDNTIIAHEYAHGLSNRLTGGANSLTCLRNAEQMGEGWSDWIAMMTCLSEEDLNNDNFIIGRYVSPNSEFGIREYPYSSDFSINNLTYGSLNNNEVIGHDQNNNPVHWNQDSHRTGMVWATVLWDLTQAYCDKYGFDPDLMNGTGGNNKIMQIVVDGLKLQPCSPGTVDSRDAILAAEMAITGGVDQCLLWNVFARRGLGTNASQGSSDNINDQVEGFEVPDECVDFVPEITMQYSIYPNPTDNILNVKCSLPSSFEIYNIQGQKLLDYNNPQNLITLNVEDFKKGVYFIKIRNTNGVATSKFVVK